MFVRLQTTDQRGRETKVIPLTQNGDIRPNFKTDENI